MMVLRAARLDLDGPHERGNMSGGRPVEPVQQAVDESGAVGIAATGGVDHRARLHARDLDCAVARVDGGAGRAVRDDEGRDPLDQLAGLPAGLLLYQLPLVVVERDPGRLFDEALEIL